ncbi:MAG: flavin reductase [Ruminococcaceae bacterium]|nr:flavin reductase [Oscillospiraceae bacterium]
MDNKAMYKLSYGLFVVTARDGKDNGCITNTAMQVTTTPNRITLAVNKENFTHDMILKTGIFNVSILSEDAKFDVFERFGFQSGRDTDKFADYSDFARAQNGVTYITNGTNAVICAKVHDTVDLGTHTLFIADVTDALTLSDAPSVTYAYYHAHIKPKPDEKKPVGKTVWRCRICGYEVEAEELPDDFICPLCKHPKEDFEKIEG